MSVDQCQCMTASVQRMPGQGCSGIFVSASLSDCKCMTPKLYLSSAPALEPVRACMPGGPLP